MQNTLRYALLAGAVVAAGAGVAYSQISQSTQIETPAPTDMAGQAERPQGRFGDRFMAEFDLNHDGKVTKDEFNKVVAQHFMQASGGKPTMTVAQFTDAHMKDFKQRVGEMFHRVDWNGDGRLSLEEFAAPIHSRFEAMDREVRVWRVALAAVPIVRRKPTTIRSIPSRTAALAAEEAAGIFARNTIPIIPAS